MLFDNLSLALQQEITHNFVLKNAYQAFKASPAAHDEILEQTLLTLVADNRRLCQQLIELKQEKEL